MGTTPQYTADADIAFGSRPRRASVGVRIGANWGSLDQELLTHLMDEDPVAPKPLEARAIARMTRFLRAGRHPAPIRLQ
jgi:hypothetical protein